ncbi:hypothetical protein MHTCC0001_31930 [Flavobacteriaceae bacterium MHTCC 0001]
MAQFAIIKDKDGFTNVRLEPESSAKVIYKLKSNEVFAYAQEDYYYNIDWIQVWISKNQFSIDCGGLGRLSGYIHRSRIQPFNKLKAYIENNLTFELKTISFDENNHVIDYTNGYVIAINGLHPWGADGKIPRTVVDRIIIKIDDQDIKIPKFLFADLFECNTDYIAYKNEDTYFIYQKFGLGIESQIVIWVIDKYGLRQRYLA